MRPIGEWADRLYMPHGHVAHVVPFGQPYALCGASPVLDSYWYGTGSMAEYDRAEELPLCGRCQAESSD